MNFDAKIKELDEEIESCDRYLEYINDNLKQLRDANVEIDEMEREECEMGWVRRGIGRIVAKLF